MGRPTVRYSLLELDCNAGDGATYRGTVAVTETGKTCQRWDSQTPHAHDKTPANYPSSGLEENYCRNPSGHHTVWCYTTDASKRWERCDIPACDEDVKIVDADLPSVVHENSYQDYRYWVQALPRGVTLTHGRYKVGFYLSQDSNINSTTDKKVFEVPGVAVENVYAKGKGSDFRIAPGTLSQQDRDRYCGSTYLGLMPSHLNDLDTGGKDGDSDRATSKPVILQCTGDYLAIYDGTGVVSLGTNQEFLYGDIDANITLDLRIRNMHSDDLLSTAPGSENFRIEVWVAERQDPLSNANTMVEVTKEVFYPPEAYHLLVAGDSIWLRNVIVTVDANKLTGSVARDAGSGSPPNFLVVKLIAGNNVNEEVIGNNFVVHNLTGKIVPITSPVENIDLEVLGFCITDIIRCDTPSAISIQASVRAKVNAPNIPKLTSYGLEKSYAVNIYFSHDDVYDPLDDFDSKLTTAALGIPAEYGQEAVHGIDQRLTVVTPTDVQYCARVYAIMVVQMVELVNEAVRQEPLLYNNFAAYPVVVQCNSYDVYGISNLVFSATRIYQNVATPVTLTFDLACTRVDCNINVPTDAQDTNYNIYIYAENTTELAGPYTRFLLQRIDSLDWAGEGGRVLTPNLQEDFTSPSGGKLCQMNADTTSVHMTIQFPLEISSQLCDSFKYVRLAVKTGSNPALGDLRSVPPTGLPTPASWRLDYPVDQLIENNELVVDVSSLVKCVDDKIDLHLKPNEGFRFWSEDVVDLGQFAPFSMVAELEFGTALQGANFSTDGSPHLTYKFYISHDEVIDPLVDKEVPYNMSELQRYETGKEIITSPTEFRLTDPIGLLIPVHGFVEYCGDVYIGVHLTSDLEPSSDGDNNYGVNKVFLRCPRDVLKISDLVISMPQPTLWSDVPTMMTIQVTVSNTGQRTIPRAAEGQQNFHFKFYLSSDGKLSDDDIEMPLFLMYSPSDLQEMRKVMLPQQKAYIRETSVYFTLPADNCGLRSKLLVLVAPSSSDFVDQFPANDMAVHSLTVECSHDIVDISVSEWKVPGRGAKSPDYIERDVAFDLVIDVALEGAKTVVGDTLKMKLFLSRDGQLDDNDLLLVEYPAEESSPHPLETDIYHSAQVDFSTAVNNQPDLRILSGSDTRPFCGRSYFIVQLDTDNVYDETDEGNNVAAAEYLFKCSGDMLGLRDFTFTPLQSPVPRDITTYVVLQVTLDCVVESFCSRVPDSTQEGKNNVKFILKFSEDKEGTRTVDLTGGEVDESWEVSPPLTSGFDSVGSRQFRLAGWVRYNDDGADACNKYQYATLEVQQGDSEKAVYLLDLSTENSIYSVPLTLSCDDAKFIDLLPSLQLMSQDEIVDMSEGTATVDFRLDVTVVLNNMDGFSQIEEDEDGSHFEFQLYVSANKEITPDDTLIPYVPSEDALKQLREEMKFSGTLHLGSDDLMFDVNVVRRYCHNTDPAFFAAIVDTRSEGAYDGKIGQVKERDETNNVQVVVVNFRSCPAAMDVAVDEFSVTEFSSVELGEDVSLSLKVSIILVGTNSRLPNMARDVEFNNYDIRFYLSEDEHITEEDLQLPYDVDSIHQLKEGISAPLVEHDAKVVTYDLSSGMNNNPSVTVPMNPDLCGKIVYIGVEVVALTFTDAYLRNNKAVQRVTVLCTEEKLAPHEVKFDLSNAKVWPGLDYQLGMDFLLMNLGFHTVPAGGSAYSIRVFLSADSVFHESEDTPLVVDFGDSLGQTSLEILANQQVDFQGLSVPIRLETREACLEMSNMHVFLQVVPDESYLPTYTSSLTAFPVPTECAEDHVDLQISLFEASVDVISTDQPFEYALDVRILVSSLASLSKVGQKYGITFYLSTDPDMDPEDDLALEHTFEETQEARLFMNIPVGSPPKQHSFGGPEGLLTIPQMAPGVGRYCGPSYLGVLLTDKQNWDLDPFLPDNSAALQIQLQCSHDVLGLSDFSFHVEGTYDRIWQDAGGTVVFDVTVRNTGLVDIATADNGTANFHLVLYSSADQFLDQTDLQVPITKMEVDGDMLSSGLAAGDNMTFTGVRATIAPSGDMCQQRYLLVSWHRGPGLDENLVDGLRDNDFSAAIFDCQTDTVDISPVEGSFEVNSPQLSPGGAKSTFSLTAAVTLTGNAQLTTDPIFNISFYLSHDALWSADDLDIEYDLDDLPSTLSADMTASEPEFVLDGTGLELPGGMSTQYCGLSYLIAILDSQNKVKERNENNNAVSTKITVSCPDDIYSVEEARLEVQDMYYVGVPAPIVFSMDVYNVGDAQIPMAGDDTHNYELKVFAQQGAMLNMDVAFDLTPEQFLFSPEWQEEHADDLHHTMTPKRYTNASAIIEFSELACLRQLDSLFLVVLSREAGMDWILYNNWVSAEITIDSSSCTAPDAVDLMIADFGVQPSDRLLLGGQTDLQLNIGVDIINSGGWPSLDGDEPLFNYQVFISRRGHKLQLPTAILPSTAAHINEETLSDRTINLGSYTGCYKDMRPGHALNIAGPLHGALTVEECILACAAFSTSYAGMQNGVECFCGEEYDRHGRAMESECDVPCGGNNDQICGGFYRNSVYTTTQGASIQLPMEELMGFCGMANTISVVVDPDNNVLETNKHNNIMSVEDISVNGQHGDTSCTDGMDLRIVNFDLVDTGLNSRDVLSTSRVVPYSLRVALSLGTDVWLRPSVSDTHFDFQFIVSPSGDYSDPDNLVLDVDYTVEQEYLLKAAYPIRQLPNEGFYTELNLDGALFLNLANYPELKRFCDTSPYLGVYVDYDDRLAEVNDLQNNMAWQHIALTCPDAGLSIEMFHNLMTQNDKISAGFPTQLNFTVSITNLGGTIPQASRGVSNIALKLLLSDTLDMRYAGLDTDGVGALELETTFIFKEEDEPLKKSVWPSGSTRTFTDVSATMTIPIDKCQSELYLCLTYDTEAMLGLQDWTSADNMMCANVSTGRSPGVWCDLDLALETGSFTVQPLKTAKVYEDTLTPVLINVTLLNHGRPLTNGVEQLDWNVYISDQSDIFLSNLNGEGGAIMFPSSVTYGPESHNLLQGLVNSGAELALTNLAAPISVPHDVCEITTFICVEVTLKGADNSRHMDATPTDNVVCSIWPRDMLDCSGDTIDLYTRLLNTGDGVFVEGEPRDYQLLLAVELAGSATFDFHLTPINIELYLSLDQEIHTDQDIKIPHSFGSLGESELRKRLGPVTFDPEQVPTKTSEGTIFLNLGGDNLVIPQQPDGSQYCGSVFLGVVIDTSDLISERSELNNTAVIPITVLCNADVLSVSDLLMYPLHGQMDIWPYTDLPVTFDVTVQNVAVLPFEAASPCHENFLVKLYASETADFSPHTATELSPTQGWQYPPDIYRPLGSGEKMTLKGIKGHLNGKAFTDIVCAATSYWILRVEKGPNIGADETSLHNNYLILNTPLPLQCDGKPEAYYDISVKNFGLPDIINVDGMTAYTMHLSPHFSVGAIANKWDIRKEFISYTLYLSKDQVLDDGDLQVFTSTEIVNVTAGMEADMDWSNPAQTFPVLQDRSFCGLVFAIVKLDDGNEITEPLEMNNLGRQQVFVQCDSDLMGVSRLQLSSTQTYIQETVPTPVNMSVVLTCRRKEDCFPKDMSAFQVSVKLLMGTSGDTEEDVTFEENFRSITQYDRDLTGHSAVLRLGGDLTIGDSHCSTEDSLAVEVLMSETSDPVIANNMARQTLPWADCWNKMDAMVDLSVEDFNLLGGNTIQHDVSTPDNHYLYKEGQAMVGSEDPMNQPIYVLFQLMVQFTGPLTLPPMTAARPAYNFYFRFVLSEDMVVDEDDRMLDYNMSFPQGEVLRGRIVDGDMLDLSDNMQGLPIPPDACGPQYLAVIVDSMQRQGVDYPGMYREKLEANNVRMQKVYVVCSNDVYKVKASGYHPAQPVVWRDTPTHVTVDLTITNIGPEDIDQAEQDKTNFDIMLALSADATLDGTDIPVSLPGPSLPVTKIGMKMGQSLTVPISAEVTIPAEVCDRIRFLLVGVVADDDVMSNNYDSVGLKLNCTADSVDLKVTSLSVEGDLTPGETHNFTLLAGVDLAGIRQLEEDSFRYKLWLSADEELDPSVDADLGYRIPNDKPLSAALEASTQSLDLSGSSLDGSGLRLPMGLHKSYCGDVYLIAEMDPDNRVDETKESNNYHAEMVRVACSGDIFGVSNVQYSIPQHMLWEEVDTPVSITVVLSCLWEGCSRLFPARRGTTYYDMDVLVTADPMGTDEFVLSEVRLTSSDWMLNPSNGLGPDLRDNNGKETVTLTGSIRIPKEGCQRWKYLGVRVMMGTSPSFGGATDSVPENDQRWTPLNLACDPRAYADLTVAGLSLSSLEYRVGNVEPHTFSLDIGVRQKNMPQMLHPDWSSEDKNFDVSFYLSDDGIITKDDTFVTHAPEKNVNYLLQHGYLADGTTTSLQGQLDITQEQFLKYCNREVYLGIVVDSRDDDPRGVVIGQIDETAEHNNFGTTKIRMEGCTRNIDLNVKGLHVTDSGVVISGEPLPLLTAVEVTSYDRDDLPIRSRPDQNYNLTFFLSKDMTFDPREDFILDYDTSGFSSLHSAVSSSRGRATVLTHVFTDTDATGPHLSVPSKKWVCNKHWYIGAYVQLTDAVDPKGEKDLYKDNNAAVQHIYVSCRFDRLYLDKLDILYLPERFRDNSNNEIHFRATIADMGQFGDQETPRAVSENDFNLVLYLSNDTTLDTARDTQLTVQDHDSGSHQSEILENGRAYKTGLLRGLVHVPSSLCDPQARPYLFVLIRPSAHLLAGSDLTNDKTGIPINVYCDSDFVDLEVSDFRLMDDNVLQSGVAKTFSLEVRITSSGSAAIPPVGPQYPERTSWDYRFYLSHDNNIDPADDLWLAYTFKKDVLALLFSKTNSSSFYQLGANDLVIDHELSHYEQYCGEAYLGVVLSDNRNAHDPVDPEPANNIRAIPINLQCPNDILAVDVFELGVVLPQQHIWAGVDTPVRINTTITNYGNQPVISQNGTKNFYLQLYLSRDKYLDYDDWAGLETYIILSDEGKDELAQTIPVGGDMTLTNIDSILRVDPRACSEKPRFLILALHYTAVDLYDDRVPGNDYIAINVEDILYCSPETAELAIESFSFNDKGKVQPGVPAGFSLTVQVDIEEKVLDSRPVFSLLLYLSEDDQLDRTDYELPYNSDQQLYLLNYDSVYQSQLMDFSTEENSLVIPKGVSPRFCGAAHIIAVVDVENSIPELVEENNLKAAPILLQCVGDLFAVSKLEMMSLSTLFQNIPTPVIISSLNVYNAYGGDIKGSFGTRHFDIQLYAHTSDDPFQGYPVLIETTKPWEFTSGSSSLARTWRDASQLGFSATTTIVITPELCQTSAANKLIAMVVPGDNPRLNGIHDRVQGNNYRVFDLKMNCSEEQVDLLVTDKPRNFILHYENSFEAGTLPLDKDQPFTVHVTVNASDGIAVSPDDLRLYMYTDTQPRVAVPHSNLWVTPMSNPGTYMIEGSFRATLEDHISMCLGRVKTLEVMLDPDDVIQETVETNNMATISDLEVTGCGKHMDMLITKFHIGDDNSVLHSDVFNTYILNVDMIATPDFRPFHGRFLLNFYMSKDTVISHDDYVVERKAFSVRNIKVGKRKSVSMGERDFIVELNKDTIPYCWTTPYIFTNFTFLQPLVDSVAENNVMYTQISFHCGDPQINECRHKMDTCDETRSVCVDRKYKFSCNCTKGYQQNMETGTCDDVDECEDWRYFSKCNETLEHMCVNTPGSYYCGCAVGYMETDGGCVDIDECTVGSHDCHEHADCINTEGSFYCTCKPGFVGDGLTCEDPITCANLTCLNHGECEELTPGARCNCPGYFGGDSCEKVNGGWSFWSEWSSCSAECGPGQRFRTRMCDRPTPEQGGEYCLGTANHTMTCKLKECSRQYEDFCSPVSNRCDQRSGAGVCSRDGGLYHCSCNAGYQEVRDRDHQFLRCDDVDECSTMLQPCPSGTTCVNTRGSYSCRCEPGYMLDTTSNMCVDVDECQGRHGCDDHADCVNLPGSYRCQCHVWFWDLGQGKVGDCEEMRLFQYGNEADDIQVTTATGWEAELVSPVIPINNGLPLFGGKVFDHVYVTENGVLVVTTLSPERDHNHKQTFRHPQPLRTFDPQDDAVAVLAPFWADVKSKDLPARPFSEVWYHAYNDSMADENTFLMAHAAVKENSGVDFTPKYILVVTWDNMVPYWESNGDQRNTFQAVLMTNGVHSYVMYLYKDGGMTWHPAFSSQNLWDMGGFPAQMGYSIHDDVCSAEDRDLCKVEDHNSGRFSIVSSDPNVYRVDQKYGSDLDRRLGKKGRFLFRLDDNADEFESNRDKCASWYHEQPAPSSYASDIVASCPPTKRQVAADQHVWTATTHWMRTYDWSSIAGQRGPWRDCYTRHFENMHGANIECCYDQSEALITEPHLWKTAGFFHRYPKDRDDYIEKDLKPLYWCCEMSPKQYCDMYMEKRPIASYRKYVPTATGNLFGDPHLRTLDGKGYSFGGYGEYVALLTMPDAPEQFILEIRTQLTANKKSTNIIALAARQGNDTNPAVEVHLQYRGSLGVTCLIDREEVSPRDISRGRKRAFFGGFLTKSGDQYVYVFSSGVYITAEEANNMLHISVGLPSTMKGKVEGLLGNYDGDWNNDFKLSSGYYLTTSSWTSRLVELGNSDPSWAQMLYEFGQSWSLELVSRKYDFNLYDLSLFSSYPSPEGSDLTYTAATYGDPTYQPVFRTHFETAEEEAAAVEACTAMSGRVDEFCLYDVSVTGSREIGMKTMQTLQHILEQEAFLGNLVPSFTVPDVMEVTVGSNYTFLLMASEKNASEYVTLDLQGPGTLNNNSLYHADTNMYLRTYGWTPNDTNPVTVKFQATDSQGFITAYTPLVKLCQCENGGTCNFEGSTQTDGTFVQAICHCTDQYRGDYCEKEVDPCSYHPCFPGVECTNNTLLQKGYKCGSCPPGLVGNGETCEDVSECETGAHNCSQMCRNTAGGFTCHCYTGFQLDEDNTCIDVDECSFHNKWGNDCDQVYGVCTNTPGGYTCSCQDGFIMEQDRSNRCSDINECLDNNGGCERSCTNTPGSYQCSCGDGYRLGPDNATCVDYDKCEYLNTCTQRCINQVGYYTCACDAGFHLHTDGKTCLPDVPCTEENTCSLAPAGLCGQVGGQDRCSCTSGYTLQEKDQATCIDIDECEEVDGVTLNQCDDLAACVNTLGNYRCHCRGGYSITEDGRTCEDVDECAVDNGSCEQECHNTIGSYWCSCRRGYEIGPDGYSCIDKNECVLPEDNTCSRRAECINTVGGYTCRCLPGYEGDGLVCADVDECAIGNGGCAGTCENTMGSLRCHCRQGMKLGANGRDCIDIDECSRPDLNRCTGVAQCVNTLASYYCTCPEQYDLVGGRECAIKSGYECMYPERADCDHECVKKPGQGPDSCKCHQGYHLVNGKDCVDINECNTTSTSPCGVNARCVNTRGSFRCECTSSFYISDIDNMACTENNGHWGSWGQYHVCQKHCDYSAMTRRRRCNNPAPSFNGAPCRGLETQTVLCARSNCNVDWDADEKSVHVTFESMTALEWVKKEEEFRRLVVNAVNSYCEKAWNYAACCPTTPQGARPGSGLLVSGSQVKFLPGFPLVLEEELEVAVMVTPLVVNDLCSSWDESLQHHNVHPVPTFTHLEKDVLKAALNAHQESYDHEGMEGVMGSRVVKMTLGTGLIPEEPYPAGWMIGVIVVLSLLGIGLVIGIVVAIMKHAVPNSLPYSNEWDISSTSTSETEIGEAWPNPNVAGSSET
ncbi:uncharacterized protein LOC144880404 [Branchiostoma floridae x Branchiostoma japonicum]